MGAGLEACSLERIFDEDIPHTQQPTIGVVDPTAYDRVVVFFSGGADSVACLLTLIDLGVDRRRIVLHHHLVDGRTPGLFDWPCSSSFCEAVARAFDVGFSVSFRTGELNAKC